MDWQHLKDWPIDELWALHAEVDDVLAVRLIAQKDELENRLAKLEPMLPKVGQK